jgi:aryl-alcohol dehydrogenase-like predicted oxidoreductase
MSTPQSTLRGPLGYGCAALVGGRTRRESLRLLDAAYDAGIRHFDVARVYGTGDAEGIVGEFARGRRADISITTKFGIDPLPASGRVAIAKRIVRAGARRSPRLLRLLRQHTSRAVSRGLFTPEKARSSLAVSLQALGLETVDAYLLHDGRRSDWLTPGLVESLDELHVRGLIGSYGLATDASEVERIASGSLLPQVAQFESSVVAPAPIDLVNRAGIRTVTFRPFATALTPISALLSSEPALADSWRADLDLDVSNAEILADLSLAYALYDNSSGPVVFSSGDPGRIARAAALASDAPFSTAQLTRFRALVARAIS